MDITPSVEQHELEKDISAQKIAQVIEDRGGECANDEADAILAAVGQFFNERDEGAFIHQLGVILEEWAEGVAEEDIED